MGIGDRLSDERGRLGMSQADFARLAGLTDRAQRLYEKGERFPDAQYLAAVAGHGVDVLYVITGQYAGGAKPAPTLTPEEATMLEYFRDAPPAVRRAAIGALLGAAGVQSPASHTVNIGDMNNTTPGGVQVGYASGTVTVGGNKRKRSD